MLKSLTRDEIILGAVGLICLAFVFIFGGNCIGDDE